jgi:ABC-type transporter Mla MlaB component
MLRITATESGNHQITLRLEGRIAGPWVTELWKACEKIFGEGQALILDLAEVSFLDPAGVTLLAKVRSRGVELADCSPFVVEQLKTAS